MAHVAARNVALRQARFAELALAIGAFAIGTGEFAAMGFLPSVANGLGVTIPEAGRSISAYALGVVVGAPLIAVLGAKLSRRALLLVLMSLFAAGNLASALAPNFVFLLGLRFASGLPHGAYFGVAALVAAGMAGPAGRARAVGRVMLGLTVATLVGTPVATWAGQALGWRTGFAFVGTLALVTVALVTLCVPRDAPARGAGPLRELAALKEPQVWLTLAIAAVGFGGMFAVFSYITPTLIYVAGIPEQAVPVVICVFGAGMVTGNVVGPRFADRALLPTIGWALVWNAAVLGLFSVAVHNAWTAVPAIFLVGTMFAAGPALQTRTHGCRQGGAGSGGRAQPFRLQRRQCAGGLARRGRDRDGLRLGLDRLPRRRFGARRDRRLRRVRGAGADGAPAFGRARCSGAALARRPVGLRRGPVQSVARAR